MVRRCLLAQEPLLNLTVQFDTAIWILSTRSERTHDTIVFGPGEAGQEAKAAGTPRFGKPIRSELGGASPTIVVPALVSKGRAAATAIIRNMFNIRFATISNIGDST